jgi:hypothetical protein
MLRNMLDAHPNISCGPESGFLQSFDRWETSRPERLAQFGVTSEQYRAHVGDLFAWMHQRRAESVGKSRWADKTPSYALRLPFIDSLFPDCQVIHIIRNPRDVIDSLRRKDGFRFAYRNAQMWESHVGRARKVGRTLLGDRYYELRYEELVGHPEAQLRALFAWLGEPWDDTVLSFRSPKASSGGGGATKPGVFTSSVGIGKKPLTLLIWLRLRRTAAGLMKELDY